MEEMEVRGMGERGRCGDGGEELAPLATMAEGEKGGKERGDVVGRGEGNWGRKRVGLRKWIHGRRDWLRKEIRKRREKRRGVERERREDRRFKMG